MITYWWEGILGLDTRIPYGDEGGVLADRMASLACAMRIRGTAQVDQRGDRELENAADHLFAWFHAAETPPEGYLRRLSLAIVIGGGETPVHPDKLIKSAEWFIRYLTKPPDKKGGWM
jgi:hypothetical protein